MAYTRPQAQMESIDGPHFREAAILSARNPFLALPLDILLEIIENLSVRDLISISLTTKGLRYLRPKRPDRDHIRDARCFVRIHRKLLSDHPQQIQHNPQERFLSGISVDKCPYCQHPLCPPTCETALFLDSDSGFFFPRHLFPTHIARFKYRGRSTQQYREFNPLPSQKRVQQAYPYSTIWCEHHRCPRNMLATEKYYNIKNGLGVPLFLKEYHYWRQSKLPYSEVGIGYWVHDRWQVGYRLPPEIHDPAEVKEDELIPIHEKFFYDSMCLHCLAALPSEREGYFSREAQFLAYFCSCNQDAKGNGVQDRWGLEQPLRRIRLRRPVEHRGCHNCGYVSVKFTRIEIFDYVTKRADGANIENGRAEGYWSYLATESKLGPAAAGCGNEKRRMHPTRPEENSKFLDIVRGPGYGLISLKKTRAGIQDLPYKVVRQILGYLSLKTAEDHHSGRHFFALRSSYCFLKGWYGDKAIFKANENLTEPYSVLLDHLLNNKLGPPDKSQEYILGQQNHKYRKLKPEAYRGFYLRYGHRGRRPRFGAVDGDDDEF